MTLVTECREELGEYETLPIPGLRRADRDAVALLRRRSGRTARRAVLYLPGLDGADGPLGPALPGGLADWYDERGFGCYLASLGTPGGAGVTASLDRALDALDGMARVLRVTEGIDTLVVSGDGAGATVAALWCADRRPGPADALVLTSPAVPGTSRRKDEPGAWPPGSRRLRTAAARNLAGGVDIGCPVLVLSGTPAGADGQDGAGRRSRRGDARTVPLPIEPHVTCLRLGVPEDTPLPPRGAEARPFYGELGRWLGAYLSGPFRDQLL
jgi:hypothetical protein